MIMNRFYTVGVAIIAFSSMAVSQETASTAAAASKTIQLAVLKGMPYSATRTITITKFGADGRTTAQTLKSLLWRDAEGRTRQEDISENPAMGEVRMINISDPVARVGYAWGDGDSIDKQANPVFVSYTPRSWQDLDIWRNSPSSVKFRTSCNADQAQSGRSNSNCQDLQPKVLNGIYVEGQRATWVIPAGIAGNGQSITVTSEKWVSPELELTIYSVQDDPRTERSVLELTNIECSKPDPSLFQPPTGRPKMNATQSHHPD
jgi:hypothetical protein